MHICISLSYLDADQPIGAASPPHGSQRTGNYLCEKFARLAETRLAQKTLTYIKIA